MDELRNIQNVVKCAADRIRRVFAEAGPVRVKIGAGKDPCEHRATRGANATAILGDAYSTRSAGLMERGLYEELSRDPAIRPYLANERLPALRRVDRPMRMQLYGDFWRPDPIQLPDDLAACFCAQRGRPRIHPRPACGTTAREGRQP